MKKSKKSKSKIAQMELGASEGVDTPIKIKEKHGPPVDILANVCEQQGVCPKCGRGKNWFGIPLVFVLLYESCRDKSTKTRIETHSRKSLQFHIP